MNQDALFIFLPIEKVFMSLHWRKLATCALFPLVWAKSNKMKNFIMLSILLICSIISTINASQIRDHQIESDIKFKRRINIIHSKIADLTNIYGLHHIKEFNEIYLAPAEFKTSVLSYIQKNVLFEKKIIAVCSMTRLPLNEYNRILSGYFTLFKKGEIDEKLLFRCFFNEFDVNYRLAKEYKNPFIRHLLTEMLNNNSLSKNFKKDVKETLSGKWYNDVEKMRQP